MAIEWSNEQKRVITERKPNCYLVSAGAGSGKTAVLSERIYQLVKEGTPIESFLVLTFTTLAASQMKSRIKEKILADESTRHLAPKVDEAHIETFDAFALYIVKRFHYLLGLSRDVNIIDNSILDIHKNKILDEILEEFAANDVIFQETIERYCVKNLSNIKELILKIIKRGELSFDKNEFYENYVNNTYSEEFVDKMISSYFDYAINTLKRVLDDINLITHDDDRTNLATLVENLVSSKSYDELYLKLKNASIPSKPRGYDDDAPIRTLIVEELKSLIKNTKPETDFGNSAKIKFYFLRNKKLAQKVLDIARVVDQKLTEFKMSKNCFGFNDIQIFALNLLKNNEDVLLTMKNTFKNILVDEYQDTSDIQEAVLNLISDKNIYMIGDIKQSIYRFRYANCNIFQDKFDSYQLGIGGEKIDLNKTFRSRREIVDGVNQMFSKLMTKSFGIISYTDGHNFEFGNIKYESAIGENQNYEMELYQYEVGEGQKALEVEANIIADDIIQKYNSRYQVFDEKTSKLRDCKFSDFSLISRRYAGFNTIRRVFAERNIPLEVVMNTDIKENTMLLVIKSFIRMLNFALNNDYTSVDFVHSFTSLARSFVFGMKDEEIYKIIQNKSFMTVRFMQTIELHKEKLRHSSLEEILKTFFEIFDLDSKMMELGDYRTNLSMFEVVVKIASNMDLMQYSLSDFIVYFDDVDKYDISLEVDPGTSASDAVTLINIHKSKGLEYKVCYFFDMDGKFNDRDIKASMNATEHFGILLPIYEDGDYASLPISMFKRYEKVETVTEQIRLFYVALTRAKEKIIILSRILEDAKKAKSLESSDSFRDFYEYADTITKKTLVVNTAAQLVNRVSEVIPEVYTLEKPLEIEYEVKTKKRASKTLDNDDLDDVLQFGNRMHYLLEILDYESKDTSFIKDKREVKYVKNVLNSELFNNVKNEQLLHEYSFFDEVNNIHGIIDCLIIKEDSITIVDFKLKNIDDEKYESQLKAYRDYISQIIDKPIKMYLLSIIDGVSKEVI